MSSRRVASLPNTALNSRVSRLTLLSSAVSSGSTSSKGRRSIAFANSAYAAATWRPFGCLPSLVLTALARLPKSRQQASVASLDGPAGASLDGLDPVGPDEGWLAHEQINTDTNSKEVRHISRS